MAEFKSGWDFIFFEEAVRTKYRYVHSDDVHEFLSTLVATSVKRNKILPAKYQLWRAQLGCVMKDVVTNVDDPLFDVLVAETEFPFPPERMKPRRNAAQQGRVNPKGIPCLYVATDQETAMAEVRPWLHAQISVGQFQTVRELRVVDFAVHHDTPLNPGLLRRTLSPADVTEGIWGFVDRAFSKPITEGLSTAEYAPTQIIAEIFRREGFDGLYYKSRLGAGFNLALFDLDSADLVNSGLFSATSLEYRFKAEG